MILAQTISLEDALSILQLRPEQIIILFGLLAAVGLFFAFRLISRQQDIQKQMSQQNHEVLKEHLASNTQLIINQSVLSEGLGSLDNGIRALTLGIHSQNDELKKQSATLSQQLIYGGATADDTKASLAILKSRARGDKELVAIAEGTRADVRNLAKDFQAGRDSAVQEVKDAMTELHNPILQKFVELAESIDARLNDTSEREDIRLLVNMMMEIRDLLKALQLPSPIPLPPTSTVPTLPTKTPAMFVYEDWNDTALYYESDTAPDIQWVRANSVDGVQGLQNEARVSSEIVGYQNARVLKLSAAPTKFPQSIGARVVLTDEKRWTALQPYAGKTLYIRYWVLWPELPQLDEQGGNAGRWCTAGFQIKDDPNTSALYQMNVNAGHKPFLTYREGAAYSQMLEFAYKPNVWTRIDMTWLMRSDDSGELNVQIDGENAYISEGRSAAVSGFASFHLLLYTDALRAPTDLMIGPVIISTEPIP